MKKISLLLVFISFVGLSNISANMTVGAVSSIHHQSLTFSLDQLEFELDIYNLSYGSLYVSADYNVVGSKFAISSADGFFWNGAIGAYLGASDSYFGLGIILPVEFGYNFPVILSGVDAYFQLSPGFAVLPDLDFNFDFGLGVRVRL